MGAGRGSDVSARWRHGKKGSGMRLFLLGAAAATFCRSALSVLSNAKRQTELVAQVCSGPVQFKRRAVLAISFRRTATLRSGTFEEVAYCLCMPMRFYTTVRCDHERRGEKRDACRPFFVLFCSCLLCFLPLFSFHRFDPSLSPSLPFLQVHNLLLSVAPNVSIKEVM